MSVRKLNPEVFSSNVNQLVRLVSSGEYKPELLKEHFLYMFLKAEKVEACKRMKVKVIGTKVKDIEEALVQHAKSLQGE